MDSARSLGSGDNFFRTRLQLPLFNATYKELPRSYVVEHIFTISALIEKGDVNSKVWATVYAFAVPMFLGASIIQLFMITISDTTNSLLGHSRKEYVVINPGEPEETLEVREVSTYKDLKELALHIAAIVPAFICYVPGIFFPGIYYRGDLKSLPNTSEQKAHTNEVNQKGVLKTERDLLLEANKTAKIEAFFSIFPTITPDNIERAKSSLLDLNLEGMTLSQVTEEDVGSYNQESWGPTLGKLFSTSDKYQAVRLSSKENFLKPIGTIELEIDCTKIPQKQLVKLLAMPHAIHRLVLTNPDMSILKSAEAQGVLSKIHTLVIREKAPLQVDQLEGIAASFRTIACFDVTGCYLDKNLSKKFIDEHIVLTTIIKTGSISNQNTTSFQTDYDNIQEQFDDLNRDTLFQKIMSEFKRSELLYLTEFFPVDGENKLFHPAAPFITKLSFFRETEVSSKQLKSLMPRLKKTFPHLRVLDLSGCKLLDSEALYYLEQYPVMNLYLDRCEGIFFRQLSSTDSYITDPRFVQDQNKRNYLVNIEYATNRLIKLFNLGVQTIRMQGMGCLKAANPNIKKGNPPQYYQIVKTYLEQCLFPEMDQIISPPDERKAFILVDDFQYGNR